MDYRAFIEEHRDRAADVSIAVKPVSRKEAPSLGLLQIDDQGKIVDFCEKPQTEAELDELRLDEPPGEDPNELYLASMGIYIFEPQVLVSLLMGSDQDDFGNHIIPDAIHKSRRLCAYLRRLLGGYRDHSLFLRGEFDAYGCAAPL